MSALVLAFCYQDVPRSVSAFIWSDAAPTEVAASACPRACRGGREGGRSPPGRTRVKSSVKMEGHQLQTAVRNAATACPSLSGKRVSPHIIRRTTAMHLLQSGVDITVIALWLNHESIETTHGYSEQTPSGQAAPRFQSDDPLPAFLKTL